jgi:hypothetical protein
MGNAVAYVALFSWPLVALGFFAARRKRYRVSNTTAWMLLLPVMFLPSAFAWDPPLLPPITKFRMGLLCALLGLRLFHKEELLKRAPLHNVPRMIFGIYIIGVLITVATNGDTLIYGKTVLPGLTAYDYLSAGIGEFFDFYLPFAVGQRVFKDEESLIDLFKVLSTCALIYAPLMLFELRMSPQLHNWVYGYYPSEFQQAMRDGGYRPIVFMNHGLSVAGWMFSCVVATLGLRAAGATFPKVSTKLRLGIDWAMLITTKSFGPIIYSSVAALSRFWSGAITARLIFVIAVLVATYPVLRAEDLFPTKDVIEFFQAINEDRAASLKFRFDNEDLLLRHAMLRPYFGWGTYGRNHVYDKTGKDNSVTDGEWIIQLGTWGYVGHIAFFTMLLMPLVRFLRRRRSMPARQQALGSMLALLVALFVLDLLPNARSDYLSLLYAGSLWTLAERFTHKRKVANKRPSPARPSRISVSVGDPEASAIERPGAPQTT